MAEQTIVDAKWKELHGKLKEHWGKLTDDDIKRAEGRREELVGLLQEKYGYTSERAQREVDEFFDKLS